MRSVGFTTVIRTAAAIAALGASAACASTSAYAPRPFPGAPVPAATRPAAIEGPASTRPAAASPAPVGSAAAPVAVSPDERVRLAADVLSTALGLRGIPYRLGGSDLGGFDCSGFVQYVLARHAVPMPRTVAEQFEVGDRPRDVEPGDLVFFQTIGSKASHVGIAVDEFSFVHAPNSRGVVRIDRLDAPYWSDKFLGARRVY
jgi:cell wall-associated NlpC family hydrolase